MRLQPVSRADCRLVESVVLQLGAIGVDKAVPRKSVLQRLAMSDRRLRAIVAAAPGMGVPLGSCGSGYYTLASEADAERAANECASRIGELRKREKSLRSLGRSLAPDLHAGLLF